VHARLRRATGCAAVPQDSSKHLAIIARAPDALAHPLDQNVRGLHGQKQQNQSRDEYARYEGERVISTNTVEGYYSIFKRGMKGVYQHCAEKHLHRYLAEFDFRYSNRVALGFNDEDRAAKLAVGIKGKRLTYRRPHSKSNAAPN